MREIRLHSQRVATTGAGVARLAPELERLPVHHPRRRFVAAMCLYGLAVDDGAVYAPYSDDSAAAFARRLLTPADDLLARWEEPDRILAAGYRVPAEHVSRFRAELLAGS